MPNTHGDIVIVLGTRPEIIKLAPVIRALGDRAYVIHTGQHWDDSMAGQFFRDLGIGEPDRKLTGMSGKTRGDQIASAIAELSEEFRLRRPSAVVVQGDTNSTSAGAQAASYAGIPVAHVEAGLRSHDRSMPEELNRLVVGVLSDLHCAATEMNRSNLLAESVSESSVYVTGNTVVAATLEALSRTSGESVQGFSSGRKRILATIHRPENTDDAQALRRIVEDLANADAEVIFAVHPRTASAIEKFGLTDALGDIDLRTGLGHSAFLALAQNADLIVSDSGGVQEEVTVLKKPLLVVRQSTERPESVEAGFSQLITPGMNLRSAIDDVLRDERLEAILRETPSPYGDGNSGEIIAELVARLADDGAV